MNVNLLHELRSVASEVGGLDPARRMSTEVRRWWLNEMRKEQERIHNPPSNVTGDGRTIVRDVPRGPRKD